MDHSPDLMTADPGDDGHHLHGGNYEAFGASNSYVGPAFDDVDATICIIILHGSNRHRSTDKH